MDEKEKKRKWTYITAAIILLLIVLLSYIFLNREKEDIVDSTPEQTEAEEALTPEEVIESLEVPTSIEGDITMSIISPEGETFEMSQARNWEARLEGIESEKSFGTNCHWEFYLNEYEEEVLYEEMENRSGVSKEDPTICGFTSTFIDSRGKLRVKLTAEIVNSYGDILETYTAEKKYTVL